MLTVAPCQGVAEKASCFPTPRIVGPGEHIVLITSDVGALFGWRRLTAPEQTARLETYCSVFRREWRSGTASERIPAAENFAWSGWPGERLYTYVRLDGPQFQPGLLPLGSRLTEVPDHWERAGRT